MGNGGTHAELKWLCLLCVEILLEAVYSSVTRLSVSLPKVMLPLRDIAWEERLQLKWVRVRTSDIRISVWDEVQVYPVQVEIPKTRDFKKFLAAKEVARTTPQYFFLHLKKLFCSTFLSSGFYSHLWQVSHWVKQWCLTWLSVQIIATVRKT